MTTGTFGGTSNSGDHNLVWETFKLFIWNQPNAEEKFQQHLRQAAAQPATSPNSVARVEKAAREGKQAAALAQKLLQKCDLGESSEYVKAWIDEVSKTQPSRVVTHLRKTLVKRSAFSKTKKELRERDRGFKISLPHTPFENGRHPQSFRSLAPSHRWEIYIDETGKYFSEQAQSLSETDKSLGRIVALALPAENALPVNRSHATELSYGEIEKLLSTLTKSRSGIFGANLKVDLRSYSWIAAISKLIRWAIMMLPIDGRTEVTFKIENRAGYHDSLSLKALEEALVDDLRNLAPERFRELLLSLELVGKDAPYNGYVDVIAHCWGSPDPTKSRLLTRTGWLGHCLLQSTDMAEIDRLYREASGNLDSDAWFRVCTHLAEEPGNSLFHDLLKQLGQRTLSNPGLWQEYLAEARHRIALKLFDAGSLGRALEWLNKYRPVDEQLPGLLELQLKNRPA